MCCVFRGGPELVWGFKIGGVVYLSLSTSHLPHRMSMAYVAEADLCCKKTFWSRVSSRAGALLKSPGFPALHGRGLVSSREGFFKTGNGHVS